MLYYNGANSQLLDLVFDVDSNAITLCEPACHY
jgi:hypothetical protein